MIIFFSTDIFFPRAGYQILLRKENKLVNPVRHGLHSESHTTIWDHPACVPSHWSWGSHGCLYDSIKLLSPGTLVIWAVTLLFHKGMAHISICTYADKPVSSWNAIFGETQSPSTMLSARANQTKKIFLFYFFSGWGQTRFHLVWACLCLLLLYIFVFQMVLQMASIIIYTRKVMVFVLLFT